MIQIAALLIASVCCLLTIATGPATAQDDQCFTTWSEAAPIVRREGLVTIEHVHRLAREHAVVEIINSTLCQAHGRYTYRLVVREKWGPLKTLVVDARQPFDR